MTTIEAQVRELLPCVEWDSCRTGHLAACPAFYRPMALAFAKRVRGETIEDCIRYMHRGQELGVSIDDLIAHLRTLLNEELSDAE